MDVDTIFAIVSRSLVKNLYSVLLMMTGGHLIVLVLLETAMVSPGVWGTEKVVPPGDLRMVQRVLGHAKFCSYEVKQPERSWVRPPMPIPDDPDVAHQLMVTDGVTIIVDRDHSKITFREYSNFSSSVTMRFVKGQDPYKPFEGVRADYLSGGHIASVFCYWFPPPRDMPKSATQSSEESTGATQ